MKRNELIELLKNTKRNLIVMVGPPMSGKSTFIESISEHIDEVISSDDLVVSMNPGIDYDEVHKIANWKEIRNIIRRKMNETSKEDINVVIDMTNLSRKSRKQYIKKYKDFNKIAVIANVPDMKILLERNEFRREKEGKYLPLDVLDSMLKRYQAPTKEDGFDHIVRL